VPELRPELKAGVVPPKILVVSDAWIPPRWRRGQQINTTPKLLMALASALVWATTAFAFVGQAFANSTPKFAYVADYQGANISAFTINSTSGALTPVGGSPFATGTSPISVTVDPSGKFVYVRTPGSWGC
jgi:hypothetical protein